MTVADLCKPKGWRKRGLKQKHKDHFFATMYSAISGENWKHVGEASRNVV